MCMHAHSLCIAMFFFCVLNFCDWSRLRNYFNSEISPIYSIPLKRVLESSQKQGTVNLFDKGWGCIILNQMSGKVEI